MILELVKASDKILKETLEPFDFSNPPVDPVQLSKDLAETMIANDGLGLAANQVGLPYRVFVINASEVIACFNPRIVDVSEETVFLDEGCLSFPGLLVKVTRPKKIKVRYTQPNGEVLTRAFDGMTSRIFQRCFDYLIGVNMLDRCNYLEREKARKKIKKLNRIRDKIIT